MADGALPGRTAQQTVLLLQGPASWFFNHLAVALRRRGARVLRVLFCPGDRLFWRGPGGVAFRGPPAEWPGFVDALMRREGVDHLVCLGAGRRIHAAAVAAAHALGVRVHIAEQGYLRPGWLTIAALCPSGRDPLQSAEPGCSAPSGGAIPPPASPVGSFANYAVMDVAWNFANLVAGPLCYPHYRTHALDGPLREWAGWLGKAALWPVETRRAARTMQRALSHRGPVFLFPLQLETDFQIRLCGPPGGLRTALSSVVAAFAAHAPPDALLVVKRHPLDNGWAPWRRLLAEAAAAHGVCERCALLCGGSLDRLLARAAGVVTVNSTVGLTALRAGVPVRCLGRAIYDRPGLTHRSGEAAFWREPAAPDPRAVTRFVRALVAGSQVRGSFDGPGVRHGAAAMADRILARVSAA